MNNFLNNEKWMYDALKEARKAYRSDEVPIGAIIVNDSQIIGKSHNQVENLKDATAHAEILAITSAANKLNDWRLENTSLYVTKEPCLMCLGAIINSRISKLYYGFSDSKNGFSNKLNIEELINTSHLNFIEGSILKNECYDVVSKFFISKRKKNKKTY